MYVYIYIYSYIDNYIYVYVYIYIYIYIYIYVYNYIYFLYLYFIFKFIYLVIFMFMFIFMLIFIFTCILMLILILICTYTYTYANPPPPPPRGIRTLSVYTQLFTSKVLFQPKPPAPNTKNRVAALARGRVFCGTRKTHHSAHMAKRVGKRIRVENTAGLRQRESSRGVVFSLRLEHFTEVKGTLCVAGF